ncbi:fibrinogen-like protein 1 isoform X2 [Hydractinia symbiolongicarpus]|nr:fibrinogen-like protein 1 isoform X2 [Hydractinia symbiolongicarpus]XP_057309210.1 fibrinogen-like protein 1 isoform X2 [Hydractinia symbiolongicarpus]
MFSFLAPVLYGLATCYGMYETCYRDEDDIMVELIGNQLRKNATAVDTVKVQNEDQCMDHCLYKGYCVSFNAIQENDKVLCELFNVTSNGKKIEPNINSSYYEVQQTCQNSNNTEEIGNKRLLVKQDCVEWLKAGYKESDVYEIRIGGTPTKVFCDMETAGGGWIKFHNRSDDSVYYPKSMQEYKDGFGNLSGDYWLGLNNLAKLTSEGEHEIYYKKKSTSVHEIAKEFKIEKEKYALKYNKCTSNPCQNDPLKHAKNEEFKFNHCIAAPAAAAAPAAPAPAAAPAASGWLKQNCNDIKGINLHQTHSLMLRRTNND